MNDEFCRAAKERGISIPGHAPTVSLDSSPASVRAFLNEETLGKIIVLIALMTKDFVRASEPFTINDNMLVREYTANNWIPLGVNTIPHEKAPPCLAQMEAAMRAIDPYVAWGIAIDSGDQNYVAHITERGPILRQWMDAKRDCWR